MTLVQVAGMDRGVFFPERVAFILPRPGFDHFCGAGGTARVFQGAWQGREPPLSLWGVHPCQTGYLGFED